MVDNIGKLWYNKANKNNLELAMIRIFLSPSNQIKNIGAYSVFNTNECEQCEAIAKEVSNFLCQYECEVMIADRSDDMNTRCRKAKDWGANLYLPIHTNAYHVSTVRGTETFFHSADADGQELARELLKRVGTLSGKARRAKAVDSLIELNTPTCTRAYIEVDFHSNPDRAKWIVENHKEIGECIGECIADFCDLKEKEENPTLYTVTVPNLRAWQANEIKAVYPEALIVAQKDEQPEEPQKPSAELKMGDKIRLKTGAKDYDRAVTFDTWVYNSILYVKQTPTTDRVVFTRNADLTSITGTANKNDIIKVEA